MNNIVIFESGDGSVEVRLEGDTVWLSLQQLAELFGRDKSVVSRHLKNIFDTREVERESVVAKNATTAADGKTYQVEYFNLDAIISVGYRVNSARATRFRQWATRVLRQHLVEGYSLDQHRLQERVQGDSVAAFKVTSPKDEKIWHAFARLITPMFQSIKANADASTSLAAIRDTLLPKLISGELRVADAEKFLEARI